MIAEATGLHRGTVWEALRDLEKARFITIRCDGRMRVNKCALSGRYDAVCHRQPLSSNDDTNVVKSRHTRRQTTTSASSNGDTPQPQESGAATVAGPYRHIQTVTDITDSKKKTATQSPATRGPSSEQPLGHVHAEPTSSSVRGDSSAGRRSLAQRVWDEDCGDVLRHWLARFEDKGANHSWAGLLIRECRRLGVGPRWLIDQVPVNHPSARSRIMGYLQNRYPVPEISDRDRSHCSFTAWDSRQRRCQGPRESAQSGTFLPS